MLLLLLSHLPYIAVLSRAAELVLRMVELGFGVRGRDKTSLLMTLALIVFMPSVNGKRWSVIFCKL